MNNNNFFKVEIGKVKSKYLKNSHFKYYLYLYKSTNFETRKGIFENRYTEANTLDYICKWLNISKNELLSNCGFDFKILNNNILFKNRKSSELAKQKIESLILMNRLIDVN